MRLALAFLLAFASANLHAQDTTCGIAWGPIINISGTNPFAYSPKIAVQGETLHVTWFGGGFRLAYSRSTNSGLSWEVPREMILDSVTFNQEVNDPWVLANASAVFLLFAGYHNSSPLPVYLIRSNDRGSTWNLPIPISSDTAGRIGTAAILGENIVSKAGRFTYQYAISTDAGETWIRDTLVHLESANSFTLSPGALHTVFQYPYTSVMEMGYRRSTDLGQTWSSLSQLSSVDNEFSDIPAVGISSGSSDQPHIYATWRDGKYGYGTLVGGSIILRRSTDAGLTWLPETLMTEAGEPVGYNQDRSGQQISSLGNTTTITWTNDLTGHINMRYSVDGGGSWSEVCDVTPQRAALVPACVITSSTIHIVWEDRTIGSKGIYCRRGLILSTGVPNSVDMPTDFQLFQNYPNPFNPATIIRYALTEKAFANIKVYDFLGQEIETLINTEQDAGSYEVKWEPKNRASGMYYYRMSVSGRAPRRQTRAMMLLR